MCIRDRGSGNTGDDEPYAVRHQLRVEDNPGITGTTGVVETDANGVTDGSSLWDLDRVDALLTALEWARRIVAAGSGEKQRSGAGQVRQSTAHRSPPVGERIKRSWRM